MGLQSSVEVEAGRSTLAGLRISWVVQCCCGISLSHAGFRSGFVWGCQAGGSVCEEPSRDADGLQGGGNGGTIEARTPRDALPAWRGQEHPGCLNGMFLQGDLVGWHRQSNFYP